MRDQQLHKEELMFTPITFRAMFKIDLAHAPWRRIKLPTISLMRLPHLPRFHREYRKPRYETAHGFNMHNAH